MSRHTSSTRRDRAAILRHSDTLDPQLRREAEALRDAGFDVDVIMLGSDRVSADEHVDGVQVRRVPMRPSGAPATCATSSTTRCSPRWAGTTSPPCTCAAATGSCRSSNSMPDFLAFAALVPKLTGARLALFMKEPMPELFEAGGREGLTRLVERAASRSPSASPTRCSPSPTS